MSSIIPLWEENLHLTKLLFGRVLDAGCGNGDYSVMLERMPDISEVVSLDILPPTVEFQSKSFVGNSPNGIFIRGDIHFLPFKDLVFDSIFCWRVMQYAYSGREVMSEFERVLKKGGRLMVRMPKSGKPSHIPMATFKQEFMKGRADQFSWRTFWDEWELEIHASNAGMKAISDTYIDKSNSQVRVFEKTQSKEPNL